MRRASYNSTTPKSSRDLAYYVRIALDTLHAIFRCVTFAIALHLLGLCDATGFLDICFRFLQLVGAIE